MIVGGIFYFCNPPEFDLYGNLLLTITTYRCILEILNTLYNSDYTDYQKKYKNQIGANVRY